MAEEMMNQQMGGGVMAPPPENVSDMGGNQQPMQEEKPSQQELVARGREVLMQKVEQLPQEEKQILANSITPEFTNIVTKIFGPAINDFLDILDAGEPMQESAPTQTEPMVAQGEGMMMNRPPVEETAPAQV